MQDVIADKVPSVTPKSVDHAYAEIKRAIVDMRYLPGESMREEELARSLGVSRTPVREAFRRLGAEGWLEIRPNQGARVRVWSVRDVEEIFEARALIEPYLAGCAVARISPEDVEVLHGLATEMRAIAHAIDEDGALEKWFVANRAFHEILTSASGNARLNQTLNLMKEIPLIKWTFRNYTEEDRERSVQQHSEIVEAIKSGDREWAESTMKSHILAARQSVLQKLKADQGAVPVENKPKKDKRRQPYA